MNNNQIKLYTYPDLLKENPLLRKLLNSESTAYFLDATFYHTYTLRFSTIIFAAIVIKGIVKSAEPGDVICFSFQRYSDIRESPLL